MLNIINYKLQFFYLEKNKYYLISDLFSILFKNISSRKKIIQIELVPRATLEQIKE